MTPSDFIERWICCGRIDDDEVVQDVAMVRMNPDTLAEQFVEYTHDPEERHITHRPDTLVITDNGDQVDEVWSTDDVVVVTEVTTSAVDNMVPTVSPSTEDKPELLKDAEKDSPPFLPMDEVVADPVSPFGNHPTSVYRVCQDVIEVNRHRRLPHPHRGDYVASVVSDIKNRLGCPAPTAANKLAVRRMANNICCKHGLRPSHTRVVIELIIAGTFVPDDADLRAARILASASVEHLREEVSNAGPTSAWYDLFHPFKNRGASRVHGNV
jgi:hypothetical protein